MLAADPLRFAFEELFSIDLFLLELQETKSGD